MAIAWSRLLSTYRS